MLLLLGSLKGVLNYDRPCRNPFYLVVQLDITKYPSPQTNKRLTSVIAGWCGEIRDLIFSDNGTVTVVYRVTIRGSDGEVWLMFSNSLLIIHLVIALINLELI